MLRVKNLTKVYRPKKGQPVTALENVSLSFPEQGMVFLLGKSGSGKSTLLNLLGGLDSFDKGEILISGQKTRRFRGKDFDAYRNTLVGFIFQEYNVLEEFTVGANIALALELQGKRATSEQINAILKEVDLEGYGARRPNELSGGQKQRVAIARALVKKPKIIMADEPTGALDSVTGRQILDTLKKLSAHKLVIVVSHDREFAEKYADRIIELADGRVVSDVEFESGAEAFSEQGITYGEDEILIPSSYRLTEEDRERINAYLAAMEDGRTLALRRQTKPRKQKTAEEKAEEGAKAPLKLIRSRLPWKVAFRIGAGALKYKKYRLVASIFLSVVAFCLFALADTFGAYDHITTCVKSICDSQIAYASVKREEKVRDVENGEEVDYMVEGGRLHESELVAIREKTGVEMKGVFAPYNSSLDFSHLFDSSVRLSESQIEVFPFSFNGYASASREELEKMNMPLIAGRMPEKENEVVITTYVCETFMIAGYSSESEAFERNFEKITSPKDMLGKKLPVGGMDFVVVGVAEPGFDVERYRPLAEVEWEQTTADLMVNYALMNELQGIREHSLAQVLFVSENTLKIMIENEPPFRPSALGYINIEGNSGEDSEWISLWSDFYGTLSDAKGYPIVWLDGDKTFLAKNEIILSAACVKEQMGLSTDDAETILSTVRGFRELSMEIHNFYDGSDPEKISDGIKVVGVLFPDETGKLPDPGHVILVNEGAAKKVFRASDGTYQYAVGNMPKGEADVRKLVKFCYDESGEVAYPLQNAVCFELDGIHEALSLLAKVFLYVGLGFALFAALTLSNFITTSIIYKKQQIGILRAIGAGGSDVYRIFFAESFIIAMINFLLSAVGTGLIVASINASIRNGTGFLITLLSFTPRQVLLLFAASLLVAALASFFPVQKFASKKPIDAIRGR